MKPDKSALSPDLRQNLSAVNAALGNSEDIVIRRFKLGAGQIDAFLLYIDGMADKVFIAENIMKSLLAGAIGSTDSGVGKYIEDSVLAVGEVQEALDLSTVLESVLMGDTALFIDGSAKALVISSKGYPTRGVEEPDTEAVIRGPREGFSEPIRINTTLIRRKIKNPNLRLETLTIGRQTKTRICIAYIKGICNEKTVAELKERLLQVDTDAIMGAGFIEAFIEDAPFSPFATVSNTERPDTAAARMLEGRIAVIIEGTPIVLTVPHLFVEMFQTTEDYLNRFYYMTMLRWVRFTAFLITLYLPGIYIALTTFHQEMIPTPLLITMAAAREGIPFPALLEALGMGLTFELLREAGVRMPRPVGQAVSIVGALVIGEAAVSAGLVGAPMVIVTALTAITSFIVPFALDLTTVLRLVMTLLAGTSGFYGLVLGTLVILLHMASLRSFGVPYLSPLSPLKPGDLKDVLVRAPIWMMKNRPSALSEANSRRQGNNIKPAPPDRK